MRSRFENTSGEVLRGPLQSGGISVQPEDLCKRAFHAARGPLRATRVHGQSRECFHWIDPALRHSATSRRGASL